VYQLHKAADRLTLAEGMPEADLAGAL